MGGLKRALLCAVASGILSGCSALHWLDRQGSFAVAADPLDDTKIGKVSGSTAPDDVKAAVLMVAYDSEQKCNQFLSDLMLNETGTNTALDIATSAVTSTAAAIAGPASTIRGLAAAGAFTSGTKTAVGADFFAKASIANYSQAIQATYFTQITAYIASQKNTGLPPQAEMHSWGASQVALILGYHAECGLGAAQNALQGTLALAQSQQQNQATTSTTLSVTAAASGTAAAGATALIIGQSTTVFLPPVAVPVNSGDKVADIATNIVKAFQTSVTSAHSEIVATAGGDGASVVLSAPGSENITWAPSVVDTVPATPSGIGISKAAPALASAATAPSPAPGPAPGPAPSPAPTPPATPSPGPTPKVGAPVQTQLQ